MRPTKTIKVPVTGLEIELRLWLTVQEQEYCDEGVIQSVKTKSVGVPRTANDLSQEIDLGKAYLTIKHRNIESYVVRIGEGEKAITDKKAILKFVLEGEFPNEDYQFILDEIDEITKASKKKSQTSDISAPSTPAA